ncbi:MAG: hypothetical protein IPM49_11380 [Flavobacteriales bacterium]|nr:hypothetical protein [Flavobacteriales bacterium]
MRFSQIVGHANFKAKLIGNIREGRIPHAQFFLGPRGSGALPLALGYAQYLLCEHKGPVESCGVCSSCQMVDNLSHPDLYTMFPSIVSSKARDKENIGLFLREWTAQLALWREAVNKEPFLDENIWYDRLDGEKKQGLIGNHESSEIAKYLSRKSMLGGYKVVLIWIASRMNDTCANKLLKLLEEPEPMNAIILVDSSIDQVLPTILSRAQLVKVPALQEEEVAQALAERYPDLKPEEARACAVRSAGDLLEAVAMAEKSEEELFVLFRDWMRACYGLKIHEAAEFAEHFARMGRERQKGLMRYGLHLVRMSLLHAAGASGLVRAVGQEEEFIRRFAAMLSEPRAEELRHELESAHQHLERNANPKVLFMDLSYSVHRALRA